MGVFYCVFGIYIKNNVMGKQNLNEQIVRIKEMMGYESSKDREETNRKIAKALELARKKLSKSHSDDDDICGSCNGSGEGSYDGSVCGVCGGSGVIERDYEPDFDPDDYDDRDSYDVRSREWGGMDI
jgi:hypothetical protein